MVRGSAPAAQAAVGTPGDGPPLDVLALIDHLPLGGAQMLLGQFAAAAPQAGVRLAVSSLGSLEGNPAAEPLRRAGVEPTDLGLAGRPGPGALGAVRAHLATVRPDIVHTHLDTSGWLGGLAARSLGIPVVGSIHGVAEAHPGPEEHLKHLLIRATAARLIAVSEAARAAYAAHRWAGPRQLVLIHNGVDAPPSPGAGLSVRRELGLPDDALVAGMFSSLRPEKGHELAIEAIARLVDRQPRLRLLIAGQGGSAEAIERLAAPLGDRVIMAGLRTDVMACLDACDICLHPSRADAFPTTLIEAMAASVPILATRVGGIPEIVLDGVTGRLVAPDAEAVTEGLAELLEDGPGRAALGVAGRQRYRDRFTAGPWVARTRSVYDEVLLRRRPVRRTGSPAGAAGLAVLGGRGS